MSRATVQKEEATISFNGEEPDNVQSEAPEHLPKSEEPDSEQHESRRLHGAFLDREARLLCESITELCDRVNHPAG